MQRGLRKLSAHSRGKLNFRGRWGGVLSEGAIPIRHVAGDAGRFLHAGPVFAKVDVLSSDCINLSVLGDDGDYIIAIVYQFAGGQVAAAEGALLVVAHHKRSPTGEGSGELDGLGAASRVNSNPHLVLGEVNTLAAAVEEGNSLVVTTSFSVASDGEKGSLGLGLVASAVSPKLFEVILGQCCQCVLVWVVKGHEAGCLRF